jgi:hypothetical protein
MEIGNDAEGGLAICKKSPRPPELCETGKRSHATVTGFFPSRRPVATVSWLRDMASAMPGQLPQE